MWVSPGFDSLRSTHCPEIPLHGPLPTGQWQFKGASVPRKNGRPRQNDSIRIALGLPCTRALRSLRQTPCQEVGVMVERLGNPRSCPVRKWNAVRIMNSGHVPHLPNRSLSTGTLLEERNDPMKIDPKLQGNLPQVGPPNPFQSPDGRFRGWKVSLPGGTPWRHRRWSMVASSWVAASAASTSTPSTPMTGALPGSTRPPTMAQPRLSSMTTTSSSIPRAASWRS